MSSFFRCHYWFSPSKIIKIWNCSGLMFFFFFFFVIFFVEFKRTAHFIWKYYFDVFFYILYFILGNRKCWFIYCMFYLFNKTYEFELWIRDKQILYNKMLGNTFGDTVMPNDWLELKIENNVKWEICTIIIKV